MCDESCWCREPLTLEINTAEIAEAERVLQEIKNHRRSHTLWLDGKELKIITEGEKP